MPFAGQEILTGAEFKARYQSLLDEVRAGEWDGQLPSADRRFGRTVIEFAAANGFADLVEQVAARQTDVGKGAGSPGMQAAIAAATYGHLNVLRVLQDCGVAMQETPRGKNSPLSEACRYGHYDVVAYLLELGADPDSGDGSGHDLTLVDIAGGEQRDKIIAALNDNQA